MRRLASAFLFALLVSGCEQPVSSIGHDLSSMFPRRADWFWKYDNDDFVEVSYWQNMGTTAPAGEDWTTFRVWVALQQEEFIPDIADGDPSDWDLQVYWAERAGGFWLAGWEANPTGPSAALGTEHFDGDGVPFAMSDVVTGKEWTSEAAGRSWTTTATSLPDDLEVGEQLLTDVWQIDVVSDAGDTPLDGSWWLALGPGLVQWDLTPFRADGEERAPWQHVYNDTWDNVMGASNR